MFCELPLQHLCKARETINVRDSFGVSARIVHCHHVTFTCQPDDKILANLVPLHTKSHMNTPFHTIPENQH